MTIEIFIDYRMHGSSEWETVEFTPEEYYDHSYYEDDDDPIEWDSVPEWDDAIEYLDVDPVLIANTRLRIRDIELGITRTITTTFWNYGHNYITERVDKGSEVIGYVMVLSTRLQDSPVIWEIMRFRRKNDVLEMEFHSFIQDNEDGSQSDKDSFSC